MRGGSGAADVEPGNRRRNVRSGAGWWVRRFDSGVEIGGFATLTNVGFSRFGEGSFDKGIFIRIPFDLFGPSTRARANLNFRTVQRDGGQRLSVDNPLWDVSRDGRADAFRAGFGGFTR